MGATPAPWPIQSITDDIKQLAGGANPTEFTHAPRASLPFIHKLA